MIIYIYNYIHVCVFVVISTYLYCLLCYGSCHSATLYSTGILLGFLAIFSADVGTIQDHLQGTEGATVIGKICVSPNILSDIYIICIYIYIFLDQQTGRKKRLFWSMTLFLAN